MVRTTAGTTWMKNQKLVLTSSAQGASGKNLAFLFIRCLKLQKLNFPHNVLVAIFSRLQSDKKLKKNVKAQFTQDAEHLGTRARKLYATHCGQRECSHSLQATSKGFDTNLHANLLTRPV